MKVWKSPVFYFGILLVLAVAGLLAAPYVIDWNSYRADLEAYGRKLTGRTVTIEGAISARLFPWPSLMAGKVSIANPPGLERREFAHAERIAVRMTLAGLLQGGIDVESVDIDSPVIRLERLPSGEVNWRLAPAADLARSDLLSRVKLDRISLNGGAIEFADRRRGETFRLDDVNATVSSPGVAGPWRWRSQAVYNDRAYDIAISTGVWQAGAPFRFGVNFAPADGSGLAFSFDGAHDGAAAIGEVRAAPAATETGKGDAEGRLRPLGFVSRVKADFEAIDLTSIEIGPVDPKEGGALVTGSAALKFGSHISAAIDLKAAMLDLDELAGAGSRALLRQAGSLALAESLFRLLPAKMSLSGKASVTALKAGGENLDNVHLSFDADRNAMRISEFSAGLPGSAKTLFRGVYFPGEQGGELSGDLALEANDLRQLVFWAWPEGKDGLASHWTGSRGRFKLQTGVSATATSFKLTKAEYELDGEPGSAELTVTPSGRGTIDLRLDAGRIDADSYMPQGFSTVSASASQGLGAVAALVLPHAGMPDLRFRVQANEVLLNGVSARDVGLDLQSGANGLDLRALDIGSVGGARLDASGLILDVGQGADGSIRLNAAAEDPRELLRLLGLIHGEGYPAWSMGLGPAAIQGDIAVKSTEQGPEVSFSISGTAGELTLSATGLLSRRMDISGEASVTSRSSGRLMALFGLQPAFEGGAPGHLAIKAAGTPEEGFMADATLQAYGALGAYRGSFDPSATGFGIEGKLSLRSTDAAPLLAAAGLPVRNPVQGVLVLDADIAPSGAGWALSGISGRFGESRISGNAGIDPAPAINGHFEVGTLALADVLASVFIGWTGAGPDIETAFASALPFGLTGQVWIKPDSLQVHDHFAARGAEIIITATAGEIQLNMASKDASGRDARIELSSQGIDSSRKLRGSLLIPVDLAKQLARTGGGAVASGMGLIKAEFEGEGRSPGGALAGLRGRGSYEFEDLKLLGLDPAAFSKALAGATDAAGIAAAFDALRGGEGFDFGRVYGTIAIGNGEVAFQPITAQKPEASVQVKTAAELALGEIDSEITISLKAREGLPPMSLSYAGPPAALARNEDNTELATKLGVTLMSQGIDELERLQREQKRLAEQEEKQRIEDQAKLEAYYAQRDELLLRKRELKVHAEMSAAEAERLRRQIEAERAANSEISKDELKQRQREIRTYRRLSRLTQPQQRPKPSEAARAAARSAQKPAQQAKPGPVILVQPETAPVIISSPPGAAPSQ